jgi:YVTN family beta-propeller protein
LKLKAIILTLFISANVSTSFEQTLIKVNEIRGSISPKSIVSSGTGLFSAQNMMYRHTITIYNANGELLTTIKDNINLKNYGFSNYTADNYLGGPVEACFSQNGKYLWVSNYSMLGKGFENEGCDACMGSSYDPSFIYKINTQTFNIENVIKVGSVPKYLAINEKSNVLVVSNWTSSDVSIINLITEKEIKRINVGKHPRGVAITKNGKTAYVTVMGSTKIAVINLDNYTLNYIYNVGKSPRHLILDKKDENLYCSINSEATLIKINLSNNEITKCKTKAGPRTMVLSENQKFMYVVNYYSDSFQKIDVNTMTVTETIKTGHHPIGITGNWETSEIWVACYEGKIQIFKDSELEQMQNEIELIADNYNQPKIKGIPTYNASIYLEQKKNEQIKKQQKEQILAKEQKKKEEKLALKDKEKNVKTKIEKQPAKKVAEVSSTTTNCQYHLIIGSFGVKSNAEKLQQKMVNKGYPAQLLPSSNNKMTMVSIQCFLTENEALSSKSKILQDSGQKGWVYKK